MMSTHIVMGQHTTSDRHIMCHGAGMKEQNDKFLVIATFSIKAFPTLKQKKSKFKEFLVGNMSNRSQILQSMKKTESVHKGKAYLLQNRLQHGPHSARGTDPDGVPQGDLVAPGPVQHAGHLGHYLRGHWALVGTAHHTGHIPAHPKGHPQSLAEDHLERSAHN